MNIQKKIERKINNIIQLTGEYPEQIEITKEEWEQLGKPSKFMNVKLVIK